MRLCVLYAAAEVRVSVCTRGTAKARGAQSTGCHLLAGAILGTRVVYGLAQDLHVAAFWPHHVCSPHSPTWGLPNAAFAKAHSHGWQQAAGGCGG